MNRTGELTYSPFGGDAGSVEGMRNLIQFASTERDKDGASSSWQPLDYMGARYYQGQTGRFMSPDAPSIDQNPFDPQSWNLYSYVRNNPLLYTDPTGHIEECRPDAKAQGLPLPCFGSGVVVTVVTVPAITPPFMVDYTEYFCQNWLHSIIPGLLAANQVGGGGYGSLLAPGSEKYSKEFDEGMTELFERLKNKKCGQDLFNGQGPEVVRASRYRFTDFKNPNIGAQTLTDHRNVFINTGGPYMTGVPTYQQPLFNRYWTQQSLRGLILLHELGHQIGKFGSDHLVKDAKKLNSAHSKTVGNACYP